MTVYTYGVFDLLHVGHIALLEEAKSLGDKLIVGVYTDEAARFKRQPIIPQDQRKKMLESLKVVDEVVYQDEYLPDKNIKSLKPDLVCKGPGAEWGESTEKLVKTKKLKYHPITSTTEIINHVRNL